MTNPTEQDRAHDNIVVSVADLKRIAPDFKAGDCIVTTSDAATLEEDAGTLQVPELPSQADDLDGDNTYDELAFQISLKPKQTRIVTVAYGDPPSMQRLRSDYPKRTAAKFTMKFDGLAWESEASAWRIYFDKRATRSTFLASAGPVSISKCSAFGFGIARAALGLGESGNFPACNQDHGGVVSPERAGPGHRAFSMPAPMLGAIIAPLTVPWIAIHYGWWSKTLEELACQG